MKEMTKYSRVAGYLEKLFDMLNADLFDGELERPIITLIPSSRSYGHYVPAPIWSIRDECKHELNIATATLNRPIEYTIATLVHEMCHIYNNEILNTQDCSRGGTYHNREFKKAAEAHGLNVTRSDKYGYSHTSPSDMLLEWCMTHIIASPDDWQGYCKSLPDTLVDISLYVGYGGSVRAGIN